MNIVTFLHWFTLASLLFWLIVYWQAGYKALTDIRKSAHLSNAWLDTMLMIAIGLCTLLIAATSLLISLTLIQPPAPQSWPVTFAGALLTVLGILGMFYCRHTLGRFWTAETSLTQNHQVVDQGPYAIIRHPIYTFACIMYLGLSLAFPAWWNVLSVAIILTAYAIKAWDEDRFLAQSLPGYAAYQKRVKFRLIPGIY